MDVPEMIKVKLEESLEKQVVDLIQRDYSMVAGEKVRNMFAQDIVKLVQNVYREPNMLEVGQMLWIGVDEEERPSYGKTAHNTRLKPVILTPISKEDIKNMGNGYSFREVREQRIVRLFNEAKEQGTLLTNSDVGIILGISAGTVSKQAREYMERENKVLPTRGIVHDIGRAVTHKRIIIRLYLQGHLVPDIARMTGHSEASVERYIKSFNKVRMLKDRLDLNNISRTLEMSEYLVKEYLEIHEEWSRGDLNA
ncbi:MAG: DUF1670 domain-containing protein [Candidatus Thermoplasmatota archaeon]